MLDSCLGHVLIDSLPDMPISGSFSSTANKGMMLKIWTNGDRIT